MGTEPRTQVSDLMSGPMTAEHVMTAGDVAQMLGCSRRHIYDLARRSELPGVRYLGRTVVIVRPVFEAWLLSGDPDVRQVHRRTR